MRQAPASFKYLNMQKLENIVLHIFLYTPPFAPQPTPLKAKMCY